MSIPDTIMLTYWRLLTGAGRQELEDIERRLASGEYHPASAKRDLAERLVSQYHGSGIARDARAHFDRVFKERSDPEEMTEMALPEDVIQNDVVWVPRLLTALGLTTSNAEARRLMAQGGVKLRGETLSDPDREIDPSALRGAVLQAGRRRFVKIL
jgi:tyrosyl-tRNA synthetase